MSLKPSKKKVKKQLQKAKEYEKKQARAHRGRHVGGSGKADYRRGKVKGEVKDWKRPLGRADVMREARKGRTEIVSKQGFTQAARDYAKRYRPGLRLVHPRSEAQKKRKK